VPLDALREIVKAAGERIVAIDEADAVLACSAIDDG
jgi:hypothetical protein